MRILNDKDFTLWIRQLQERLLLALPGVSAHGKMAPVTRPVRAFRVEDFPDARKAAVLILLYPDMGRMHTVFMRRSEYPGVHSRQVSFPGGGVEPQDRDPEHTALRETEEEIGVPATDIRIIGKLSDIYIPPSDFYVFPYIGYLHTRPHFQPNIREVDMLIESPLEDIFLPEAKGTVHIERKDGAFDAPCYFIGGEAVWGATAIILSELEDILLAF